MRCPKQQTRSQFSKYRFQNESALGHELWQAADSFWNWYFENCDRACFFGHLIFLLTDRILLHSHNFERPKQRPKYFFKIFYFFSACWVRKDFLGVCPEKFSLWNFFGTERFTIKFRFFTDFLVGTPQKKYRARVPTILMPPTFPIASLNGYTRNFLGGG